MVCDREPRMRFFAAAVACREGAPAAETVTAVGGGGAVMIAGVVVMGTDSCLLCECETTVGNHHHLWNP